jgi:predicted PurR-regulated permease PerM
VNDQPAAAHRPVASHDGGWRAPAALIVIATIVVLAAARYAGSVLAPIACAIFIIAVVWPLQERLQARLPKLVALAIVILVTALVLVVFASLIGWSFGRVGRWVVNDAARLQSLYTQVTAWLESYGIGMAGLLAEHFDVRWLVRTVQDIAGRANATVTFGLVVLVYVILGLIEVGDVGRKVKAMENREVARVLYQGSVTSAARFRRYMLMRTLMSVATGAFVWALAALAGLQFAAEWGLIAFALNYIPFIGPFFATVLPTLFALAQFASWQAALAVFVCLNLIQFVIGSYLEPRLSGKALAMSPFVVLFAVFFWTFLWGMIGAVIGVPITIAVLAFCAQHPSSRWVADLFGAPPDEPAIKPPG